MNAIILCAGFATRMYPLTRNFPKPLLEVGGKPVLDYLIEEIVELSGIQAVHVVTNARFHEHFKKWRDNGESAGRFADKKIHIHNDGCPDNETRLGAAADLLLGLNCIDGPGKTLVAGGDNIFKFPLRPLWDRFLQSGHHMITALSETDPEKLRRTGVLELLDDGRVARLHEKPDEPQSTWISPPLYFFQPSVTGVLEKFLKTPGNHDAPGYFIDYLAQAQRVDAFKVNSGRFDIGCMESYRQADRELNGRLISEKRE